MAKKIFLISFLVLLFFSLIPNLVTAALVTCGDDKPCTWKDLKDMIERIGNFILTTIVPVVAGLMFTIGGIILLCAGGSPNLKSLGKKIMFAAIIGAAIAFGAKAIIEFILKAIGSKISI